MQSSADAFKETAVLKQLTVFRQFTESGLLDQRHEDVIRPDRLVPRRDAVRPGPEQLRSVLIACFPVVVWKRQNQQAARSQRAVHLPKSDVRSRLRAVLEKLAKDNSGKVIVRKRQIAGITDDKVFDVVQAHLLLRIVIGNIAVDRTVIFGEIRRVFLAGAIQQPAVGNQRSFVALVLVVNWVDQFPPRKISRMRGSGGT